MSELKNIFGPAETDPMLQLISLTADVAVIKSSTADTNRRLEGVERMLVELQGLGRIVAAQQMITQEHERRLGGLETRAESIDKNVDEIAMHARRLETLERDLIPNGELRMSQLENAKKWLFGAATTAFTGGVGWFLITYVVPLLKH